MSTREMVQRREEVDERAVAQIILDMEGLRK